MPHYAVFTPGIWSMTACFLHVCVVLSFVRTVKCYIYMDTIRAITKSLGGSHPMVAKQRHPLSSTHAWRMDPHPSKIANITRTCRCLGTYTFSEDHAL